jgi:hypothetical protein
MTPKRTTPPVGGEEAAGEALPPGQQPQKRTKKWWQGARGKKDMMRAVQDRLKKQDEAFQTMGTNPFADTPPIHPSASPSATFRDRASQAELARYLLFLIQSMLLIIRVWKLDPELERTYGQGEQTSGRMALLLHHTRWLSDDTYTFMTCMERNLFARVVREGEAVGDLKARVADEWEQDRREGCRRRLDTLIRERVLPCVLEGRFPRINFSSPVVPERQYDAVWKDILM